MIFEEYDNKRDLILRQIIKTVNFIRISLILQVFSLSYTSLKVEVSNINAENNNDKN